MNQNARSMNECVIVSGCTLSFNLKNIYIITKKNNLRKFSKNILN